MQRLEASILPRQVQSLWSSHPLKSLSDYTSSRSLSFDIRSPTTGSSPTACNEDSCTIAPSSTITILVESKGSRELEGGTSILPLKTPSIEQITTIPDATFQMLLISSVSNEYHDSSETPPENCQQSSSSSSRDLSITHSLTHSLTPMN